MPESAIKACLSESDAKWLAEISNCKEFKPGSTENFVESPRVSRMQIFSTLLFEDLLKQIDQAKDSKKPLLSKFDGSSDAD